ncbi:MAG: alpha-L-fucosidase [Clostridia bacterium]|nr:alpha-L-fucosidase [Clostridia bacterium]
MKKNHSFPEACLSAHPTRVQLDYQQSEFNALLCYGMPPFTGVQYGNGFTPASSFWPEDFDANILCDTIKAAGMSGVILIAKHYDGYCLWPTAKTDYSVRGSTWRDGEGDFVAEVSAACRRYGLKFGVSVAPWDLHEPTYGTGRAYDDFFVGLLEELLTNYGDIFCVRFDGVCGAEKPQDYDWERYYATVRSLAPDAAISFAGPDIRYSGNDRGVTRKNEWSVIPASCGPDGDSDAGVMELDLGSRKRIKNETDFIWYPCEVAVPLRAHWFFTADDKYSSKTKDKLLDLYGRTVGSNANLLLGLSPDKKGRLDEVDDSILRSLGKDLELFYGFNLLSGHVKEIRTSSEYSESDSGSCVRTDDMRTAWRPSDEDKKPFIEIEFNEEEAFDRIILKELITNGEHVEEFAVFAKDAKGRMKRIAEGENIGHKKIFNLKPIKTSLVRIEFTAWRGFFELEYVLLN